MNLEHLRFIAQYLEVAQIEMKFIDPAKNYTSLISPKQLETLKYGYEIMVGQTQHLQQATVLLESAPIKNYLRPDRLREKGMMCSFGDYSEE